MDLNNVRTRFAPSPTGRFHFGNANTALFNWLIARRYGGVVVLRMEDTDTERSTKEYERLIIADLEWLGIDWDEGPMKGGEFGPYYQSERGGIYEGYTKQLLESGAAYKCYCTKEELDHAREEARSSGSPDVFNCGCRAMSDDEKIKKESERDAFSVRFMTPKNDKIVLNDLLRGPIEFDTNDIDDFIIARSDGSPTFLLTNAVDDALMKITHVVRGEDHISNTPKQMLVNRTLGLHVPEYLHTAMILGQDRTKLSKRHGAVSVFQFREKGYLPESMVNYLAFLGWNPKDDREFFTIRELAEAFSIEAMSKAPSVFDEARLHYLNAYWMKTIDRSRVVKMWVDYLVERGYVTADESETKRGWIERIVEISAERVKILSDIDEYADFFFKDVESYDEKGVKKHFSKENAADNIALVKSELAAVEPFNHDGIEKMYVRLKEEKGLGANQTIHPVRLALTGKTFGPSLFELMELLGQDVCLARLDRAEKYIRETSATL